MKVEKTEITKTVQVTTGYKMNVVNDCNNSYSDNELNIYNEWLEKLQGPNEKAPDYMWLVLGNKENIKKYKVSDYQIYFKKNKENYVKFLNSNKKQTYPERCQFCNLCDWIDSCEKKWSDDDHLNQIKLIRRDQIRKIYQHGEKNLTDFSKLKETEKIKDLNPSVFKTHLSQAKLLKKYQETGKPQIKLLPLKEGRGFNKLPKHSINDLYFDIEGLDKILNPEENSQSKSGLEYLFGIYNHGNTDFIINNGDRIAQMVLSPVVKMDLEETNDLPETLRGEGGFGSTGK